jgi:hypothetical protein
MEENFPPFNPSPSDSMQVLMYKAGQRSVVEWFIDKLQEQE